MKTVYHPTFAGLSREVPNKSQKKWLAAGWLTKAHKPSGKPVDAAPTDKIDPEGTPA